MADSAISIFKLLHSAAARPAEFLTRDSGIEVGGGTVKLAVDSRGLPLLLVPLSSAEASMSDARSRGILIETHLIVPADESSRTLLFRCEDAALTEQFARLVDDIMHSLARDTQSPGAVAIAVFERWRSLFEPTSSTLLNREAQIGLLAELHFLERLVDADRLGHEGLAAWTGPEKARHDFVVKSMSVEVKATTSRDQFLIAIHGAKQLESPEEGSLYVYAEQFEEAPGGDSLASAVERLTTSLDDAHGFLQRLQASGYSVADREAYSLFTFRRVRSKVCAIDNAFPRIVRKALKNEHTIDQIQGLQYSIDIGPLTAATSDLLALDFASELMVR